MPNEIPGPKLLTELLLTHIREKGLPEPVLEHRFAPPRRWRFDLAWPLWQVALEIEGGTWMMGRHNRPQGYEKDIAKYNEATLMGWIVLRATTAMVEDGRAAILVERALSDA